MHNIYKFFMNQSNNSGGLLEKVAKYLQSIFLNERSSPLYNFNNILDFSKISHLQSGIMG